MEIIADYLVNSLEHAPGMTVAIDELAEVAGITRRLAVRILYTWVSSGHNLTPVMTDDMTLKILNKITE